MPQADGHPSDLASEKPQMPALCQDELTFGNVATFR